jgi:conjugative relaxase-like TrwC/TraI family protein
VLSIRPGHSVEYLTREVATGRENYYTGAVSEGEPPGRWNGSGAEALGLTGLVDHQDMEALYEHFIDPRDPAFKHRDRWDEASKLGHAGRAYKTAGELYEQYLDAEPCADAERCEQLRLQASKNERKNIAFMDVTFSVPKSVTVLHAAFEAQEVKARRAGDEQAAEAWAAHKRAIEDAIWAGNNVALDYLQERAGYSRVGHHGGGAGRFIDAHDWTVASFFQHTSRSNDPQLHIHNGILWRVLCADGVWRTLDSKSLELHRPAAGAIAQRTMFEHASRSLHVLAVMRPDGKSREVLGIEQAINDLFSTRRRAITPKAAELVRAFVARYGREPTALELDRLHRQATMMTRPRKSHDGETLEQRLDRCEAQLQAELSTGLDTVAADVLARANKELAAQRFDPDAVMQIAIADVQAKKAHWTEADLARAVNDALPGFAVDGLPGPVELGPGQSVDRLAGGPAVAERRLGVLEFVRGKRGPAVLGVVAVVDEFNDDGVAAVVAVGSFGDDDGQLVVLVDLGGGRVCGGGHQVCETAGGQAAGGVAGGWVHETTRSRRSLAC